MVLPAHKPHPFGFPSWSPLETPTGFCHSAQGWPDSERAYPGYKAQFINHFRAERGERSEHLRFERATRAPTSWRSLLRERAGVRAESNTDLSANYTSGIRS